MCDCFMDGTKELRTQNPVVTGVLVLEAMTLIVFAQPSDSPGDCFQKHSNLALV